MANQKSINSPKYYRIVIKDHLDKKWSDWFDEMEIRYTKGKTILTGYVADQSALHGLLDKIRDLNLNLFSVDQIDNKKTIK